jgi:hypothetical protein
MFVPSFENTAFRGFLLWLVVVGASLDTILAEHAVWFVTKAEKKGVQAKTPLEVARL